MSLPVSGSGSEGRRRLWQRDPNTRNYNNNNIKKQLARRGGEGIESINFNKIKHVILKV